MKLIRRTCNRFATRLAVAVTLSTAGAAAISAAPAHAFVDFHYGSLAAYSTIRSDFYLTRAVAGWADGSNHLADVWAYILVPGGSPASYGSAVQDWGYVCHSYSGDNYLQGVLHNPHSVGQNPMRGRIRVAPETAC